jgi:hypothetical protein
MSEPTFYHVAKRSDRDSILRLGLLPTVDSVFVREGLLTFSPMLAADPGFAKALLDSGRTPGVNLTDDLAHWAPQADDMVFEVAIDDSDENLLHLHRWWWRYNGIIRPNMIRSRHV